MSRLQKITKGEAIQAQFALLVAVALQAVVWQVNSHVFYGPQFLIIAVEIALAVVFYLAASMKTLHARHLQSSAATIMLGILSAANVASLGLVIYFLITGDEFTSGLQLLASALAIFLTNVIVFAFWYWEIDSPGLTRKRWSAHDKDFQFPQQDRPKEFPDWRPEFVDYMYLSLTNAINFAPADTRPVTRNAKVLMGTQAIVSALTLGLVLARSVSILGS